MSPPPRKRRAAAGMMAPAAPRNSLQFVLVRRTDTVLLRKDPEDE